MKIGYARVSTADQSLDLQIDALKEAGVAEENIYIDKLSGKNTDRPEFQNAIKALREGDMFVFYKLDRVGRSLKDLLSIIEELQQRKVDIFCIHDNIDTTTPAGVAMFQMMGVFAQYERAIIAERTKAGLESARARGRKGGRPPLDPRQIKKAIKLYEAETHTVKEIQEITGVNKGTLYRAINKKKAEQEVGTSS